MFINKKEPEGSKTISFFRKIAALTLAAVSLLTVACTGGKPEETLPDTTIAEETTEPAPSEIEIIKDGTALFTIVRPDENAPVTTDAVTLKKRIKRITGIDMDIGTDFCTPTFPGTKNEPEILVGACDRDESREFIDSLPENGYGFKIIGNKLVIAGKNDSLTAMALQSFENVVLYDKNCLSDKNMIIPADLNREFTTAELTHSKLMTMQMGVQATFKAVKKVTARDGFSGTQGSATDGTYYYVTLHKKVNDVETNKIVKIEIATGKDVLVSGELTTDHNNDMCYDTKRDRLVIPNMNGKLLTIVDPVTLEIVEKIDASWLPGTPWAIAYNEKCDRYVIAAGGTLNICDGDFKVVSTIASHSEPNYTGQGMDCDDEFIYMPLSTATGKSTDNIIVVYSWDGGYLKTIHMDTTIESETMLNYDGRHFVTFNGSPAQIAELTFTAVYN